MRPIETNYRGCHFRSRIEARWAVFFETLGIKWWYEPEGFSLRFDYEEFLAPFARLNFDEDELLELGVPQTFAHLDGKEYSYLPDFYLPELHYWVEIKGANPTREEIEKAFMLNHMVNEAIMARVDETSTEAEREGVRDDLLRKAVFIIYGDVPWPFPEKGNIFGFGSGIDSDTLFDILRAGEAARVEREYRSLLMGRLKLCWQECPLCLKIGVGRIGEAYCSDCHDQVAEHIWDHLATYPVISEAGTQYPSDQAISPLADNLRAHIEAETKAGELTKGLINPEFFSSGHKSPKLREAYNAARSARFEHGQSP